MFGKHLAIVSVSLFGDKFPETWIIFKKKNRQTPQNIKIRKAMYD